MILGRFSSPELIQGILPPQKSFRFLLGVPPRQMEAMVANGTHPHLPITAFSLCIVNRASPCPQGFVLALEEVDFVIQTAQHLRDGFLLLKWRKFNSKSSKASVWTRCLPLEPSLFLSQTLGSWVQLRGKKGKIGQLGHLTSGREIPCFESNLGCFKPRTIAVFPFSRHGVIRARSTSSF